MTFETRATIQLQDIKEVEIECAGCHTRIAWNPASNDKFLPLHCKNCETQFFIENSPQQRDMLQLLSLIDAFKYTANYALRFSIGDPKEQK